METELPTALDILVPKIRFHDKDSSCMIKSKSFQIASIEKSWKVRTVFYNVKEQLLWLNHMEKAVELTKCDIKKRILHYLD